MYFVIIKKQFKTKFLLNTFFALKNKHLQLFEAEQIESNTTEQGMMCQTLKDVSYRYI